MKNILLIGFLFLATNGCTSKSAPPQLTGVKFENTELEVKNFHEKTKNPNDNVSAIFENDNKEILRIYENSNDIEKAKKVIAQKTNEIRMLFAPQQAPYFGQITKEIKCTDAVDLKAQIFEDDKEVSQLLNLTATDRFIYGSCIADQEIYRSQLLFLYCKKASKLYELRYFYDKGLPAYKKQIAHCE